MVAALSACQWDETRFFDLRVVNNTHRTVRIRPCWDVNCLDMSGMRVAVLRPGDTQDEGSLWTNDAGEEVSVAVLGPVGKQHIIGCLITSFKPGQPKGLVRMSQERPCISGPEGGPGG